MVDYYKKWRGHYMPSFEDSLKMFSREKRNGGTMKQEVLEKGKEIIVNRFMYTNTIEQLNETENCIYKFRGEKEPTPFEMNYNHIIDECKIELIRLTEEKIKLLDKEFEEL